MNIVIVFNSTKECIGPRSTQQRKQKVKRQLEKIFAEAEKIVIPDDCDEDWNIDTSEEAMIARRNAELSTGMLRNIAATSISSHELFQSVRTLIRSSKTDVEKVQELQRIQKRENFGFERVCELVFDSCFDKNISTQLGKQILLAKHLLQTFGTSKIAQKVIIGKLERITFRFKLLSSFKDILFAFYDAEILEEESISEWYSVPTPEYSTLEELNELRREAFPFVEWLEVGSEEEEEEDEDDDIF